jgi:hypothetical protein
MPPHPRAAFRARRSSRVEQGSFACVRRCFCSVQGGSSLTPPQNRLIPKFWGVAAGHGIRNFAGA